MNILNYIKELFANICNAHEPEEPTLEETGTEMHSQTGQSNRSLFVSHKKRVLHNFYDRKESLLRDFPRLEVVNKGFDADESAIAVGVKLAIQRKNFIVLVESDITHNPPLFYGLRRVPEDAKHPVSEPLQQILTENQLLQPTPDWYGWKSTSVEDGYEDLKKLIETITASCSCNDKVISKCA